MPWYAFCLVGHPSLDPRMVSGEGSLGRTEREKGSSLKGGKEAGVGRQRSWVIMGSLYRACLY